MDIQNRHKLKNSLRNWPKNSAMTAAQLAKCGVYRQLAKAYVDAGWIKKEGRGLYSRLDDKIGWEGILYALQKEFPHSFHLGAYSALEQAGYGHFVRMSDIPHLFLFTDDSKERNKLPAWFKKVIKNRAQLIEVHKKLFEDNFFGIKEITVSSVALRASISERAILEMLALIPEKEDFEHAHYIMQGLRQVRPQIMQTALEKCVSIKAKRLFLYFAEKNNFPFLKELNLSKISLGHGERKIGQGGCYDAKHHISVPIIRDDENV